MTAYRFRHEISQPVLRGSGLRALGGASDPCANSKRAWLRVFSVGYVADDLSVGPARPFLRSSGGCASSFGDRQGHVHQAMLALIGGFQKGSVSSIPCGL